MNVFFIPSTSRRMVVSTIGSGFLLTVTLSRPAVAIAVATPIAICRPSWRLPTNAWVASSTTSPGSTTPSAARFVWSLSPECKRTGVDGKCGFSQGLTRIKPRSPKAPHLSRPSRKLARDLRPASHLRPHRPRSCGSARHPQLCPRTLATVETQAVSVRVRDHSRGPCPPPPVGALLPDRDAVHHLRRRGDLLLPVRRAPTPAQVVRAHRDGGVHGHPRHRPRPHLAKGRPGLGVEELVASLGDNILTTTLGKVIGWGRGNSVWPAQFGLACCAIEMISTATAGVDIARF